MIEFYSDQELLKYVEQEITTTRNNIKVHTEKAEEQRRKYTNLKGKYNEELLKGVNIEQRKVSGFKVLMNPTVEYELYIHESIVASLQEKLEALERTKSMAKFMHAEGVEKVVMIVDDGKPIGFMVYKKRQQQ
ncbi:hypothetical protein [Candidatus Nitrosocaldus cavascurensis]|jgi:hypothetical protein|nr:hypothetical protein [Candidatus Nitrosocaldus cavascurensis]